MLLEILLLPIETTDMLLKEAPAWSTITSNKSFDITFLFTLPSLINTVLLVVAVSFLYSSPPATYAGAGELNCTTVDMKPQQVVDIKASSGGFLMLSHSLQTVVVVLNGINSGIVIGDTKGFFTFFTSEKPAIHIYKDDTGWHIKNCNTALKTIVYSFIGLNPKYPKP